MLGSLDRVRRAVSPALGVTVVVGCAVLAMAALIAFARGKGYPPDILLYNPAYQFRFWPYAGLLLHIGVFAMGAAGAISVFAAFHAGRARALLFAAGAFSLLLAADDFFMLHQHFWPQRGIRPGAVYFGYGALAVLGAWRFRRELSGRENGAVWAALLLMTASLATDFVSDSSRLLLVVEDMFKFAGFCLWSIFWIGRAHRAVAGERGPPCPEPAR